MAVTSNSAIFTQAPVVGIGTLTSATPITSRANITGTTGLVAVTPASTNGKRVDWVRVQGKATNTAFNLFLWINDGTTSYLFDEVVIPANTASTTARACKEDTNYISVGSINLPSTYRLYASQTVANDCNVIAFGGDY